MVYPPVGGGGECVRTIVGGSCVWIVGDDVYHFTGGQVRNVQTAHNSINNFT